jgi:hypothetical protein
MKVQSRICDRCKRELPAFDQALQDAIDEEYPGNDICCHCDLDIKLYQGGAKQDLIHGWEQGAALKKLLARYEQQ